MLMLWKAFFQIIIKPLWWLFNTLLLAIPITLIKLVKSS